MSSVRSMSVLMLTALGIVGLLIASAAAEIAPQYRTWQDFGAVVSQSSIPGMLGDVDRIERTPQGKYIVRAGACFVEITVHRESSMAPGGSYIGRVEVGEKRCN